MVMVCFHEWQHCHIVTGIPNGHDCPLSNGVNWAQPLEHSDPSPLKSQALPP